MTETVLSPREGNHIPIYTHPVADAPTVARAEGPVVARGRIEGWYRVLTDEGLYGWVPEAQTATGSQATPSGKMRPLVPSGPPQIKLDRPAPALSTTAGKMTVGGSVLGDRPIKDLRVFVNRKKVFFKSSAGLAASKLDFTTSVSLEEGLNRIDVVARQRDETATSKTLLIHRDPAP